MRGPQGVRLGRNTSGGVIDILMKAPSDKVEGYGEFSYGAYSRYTGRASINLPLNQSVALKLSGYYQTDKGYVHDNTTGERLNDNDGAGLRLALRLKFSDRLSWNGAVAYMRSQGENILNFDCDPANPAQCNGRYTSTGLRTTTSGYAPLAIAGRKAEFGLGNTTDNILYTSNFEWAGDNFTLNAITGYVDLTQTYGMDYADGRGVPSVANPVPAVQGYLLGGLTVLNDGSHRQFSQELKLSGALFGGALEYATGFLVTDAKDRTDFAGLATGVGGSAAPQLLADRVLNTDTTAWAGYFQGGFHVSSQFKLSAGVRYTDETRTLRIADNRAVCTGSSALACLNQSSLFAPSGAAIPTRQTTRQWTPRFAVEFTPGDALMLFASASRGYRSGGWDTRSFTASGLLPFAPETVWSYEAGAKAAWFDQRLSVNLTAFLLDAHNVQTATGLVPDGATTTTVAGLRNKGVELEVVAAPIEGLRIFANAGFQDANYRVDRNASAVDQYGVRSVAVQQANCLAQLAAGSIALGPATTNATDCATGIVTAEGGIARPVRTPRVNLAAGGSYDFKVPAAGIVLTPSAQASYRSAYETAGANGTIYAGPVTAGGTTYPANPYGGTVISGSHANAFVLVDAAMTLRTDDNNWTLALECSNCLDRTYVASSLANYAYLGPPRSWQVRLKRVF